MEENKEYTYYAFISYKREEEQWAKWLQRKLEHYRFPTNLNGRENLPERIYPTFRDVTDLTPGQLAVEIDKNLRDSEWLIVMCSPRSAQSPWVCKEAQTFIDLGRADHIIPFIIDGTPFSDDVATECYPEALKNLTGQEELLAANINEMGRDAAAIKVVSCMFNIRFDILWQRYERERRKRRNWIISGVTAFVLLLIGITGYILYQNNNLRQSNSRAAANAAERLIEEGDSYTARRVAAAALEKTYTPEAEAALRHAYKKSNAILRECSTSNIISVDISPDGEKIVSVSNFNTILVWDANTGRCLDTLKGPTDRVCVATFSPDGKKIMSTSLDEFHIWDAATGVCLDSSRLNAKYHIWDFYTGSCLDTSRDTSRVDAKYNYVFYHSSHTPNGKMIVSFSTVWKYKQWIHYPILQIFDAATFQCLHTLEGHTDIINDATFSPDGKKLVSASRDETLRIWDVTTGRSLHILKGHIGEVTFTIISPNGKRIASVSMDKTLRIWDATTGQCLHTLEGHTAEIYYATFSPDGEKIVSASMDNTLRIWDVASGHCLHTLKGHTDEVNTAKYSHDGKRIVSASKDNTIRIWDATTGYCYDTLVGHSKEVLFATFSQDGKRVVSSSNDRTIRIWDVTKGNCFHTIETNSAYNEYYELGLLGSVYFTTSFSHDGRNIISTDGKTRCIWDVNTGRCLNTLNKPKGCFHAYGQHQVYSPDGKKNVEAYYFWAGPNQWADYLEIWDVSTVRWLLDMELKGHTGHVYNITFSIDGKRIVTASEDSTLRVWDAITGRCLSIIHVQTNDVQSIAFSPNGRQIVGAIGDKLHLWSVSSGRCILTMNGHTSHIKYSGFSTDGKKIVSTSEDRSLRVWDAFSGRCLMSLNNLTDNVNSVKFSPDSKRIVSASDDNNIIVWDVATGKCLIMMEGHTDEVWSAAFSSDGEKIVSSSKDGTIRIWDFPSVKKMIDMTHEQFKNYPLSPEERKLYYLE